MIGRTLAHYRVTELLGEGGMGEVYRARDTKLDRDVALKVLPDRFARDAERVRRFNREARLLASLSHANIAAAYGLEAEGETRFLVLELVPGLTLEERLARGPVPVAEALAIAGSIADALEAAHEQAIVHRDLKPANVKITPDGQLKVLDFGLAKALASEPDADTAALSPTITSGATALGTILGTPAYMSPEQARGEAVDRRADVWAFGALVYEMLTGVRAFAADNVSETLARILTVEPDFDALPPDTPTAVRRCLELCLIKDPKRRIRDIGDVRLALEGAFDPGGRAARKSRPVALVAAALALLATAIAGVVTWTLAPGPGRRVVRAIATAPDEGLHMGPPVVDVAVSDDGRRVLFSAVVDGRRAFRTRRLDELETKVVGDGVRMRGPFLSPDGRWIGYFDGAQLRKVPAEGGPSVLIGEGPGGLSRGASWSEDGTIVFATRNSRGLWRVPADGGEPRPFTQTGSGAERHSWPEVLPDGAGVLFSLERDGRSAVAVVPLDGGPPRVLVEEGSNPQFVRSGHVVYGMSGALGAVRFDPARLEVVGEPVTVLRDVFTKPDGPADFALSPSGTLLYVPGSRVALAEHRLVWVRRDGSELAVPLEPRLYYQPRLSPVDDRIAVTVFDGANEIWIQDPARETLTRLTFDPGEDTAPVWSPDGRTVVFASDRERGVKKLFARAADGTGAARRLVDGENPREPESFSPDGRFLLFTERHPERGLDLGLLSLEDGAPTPLVATSANETEGRVSPDGRFLAYRSDESGRSELYVRPFPDVDGGRWQVTTEGGEKPMWAPDGGELLYRDAAGRISGVSFRSEPAVAIGRPVPVVEGDYVSDTDGSTFDVARDGARLLMMKRPEAVEASVVLVLEWLEELDRLTAAR